MSFEEQVFFSQLAIAYQKGRCFLTGNYLSLERLSSFLGKPNNNLYRIALGNRSFSRSLMEIVDKVFVIYESKPLSIPPFLNDKKYLISLEDALKWNISDQCNLIAENLDDCEFYVLLGRHYFCSSYAHGVTLNFNNLNGGGDTICKTLEQAVLTQKCPSLCFVDSDKKYGGQCSTGNTCKRVRRVYNKITQDTHVPCFVYELDAHEVENLIPLSLLAEITEKLPAIKQGLALLEKLKSVDGGQPILYYDFKNGIDHLEDDSEKAKYWREILSAYIEEGNNSSPVVSNKLLRNVIEVLSEKLNAGQKVELDQYLVSHWENIGSQVATWGCAHMPIRA